MQCGVSQLTEEATVDFGKRTLKTSALLIPIRVASLGPHWPAAPPGSIKKLFPSFVVNHVILLVKESCRESMQA